MAGAKCTDEKRCGGRGARRGKEGWTIYGAACKPGSIPAPHARPVEGWVV